MLQTWKRTTFVPRYVLLTCSSHRRVSSRHRHVTPHHGSRSSPSYRNRYAYPNFTSLSPDRLHHYHLGEAKDPDLVERNLEFLRDMEVPMAAKYAVVAFFMPVWKWFYYAPNTYKELKVAEWKREGKELPNEMDPTHATTIKTLFSSEPDERAAAKVVNPVEIFTTVLGPFFVSRFVLLPAVLLAVPGVGTSLFMNAIVNLLVADLVSNIHAFLTIVTNHAGEDVYSFDDEVKPNSGAFYVRQVVGSVNYDLGNDAVDFAHGWLNYQIEHHVWPSLSMLQYQRAAPELQAICQKYGVPYVKENVFERLRKTVDIMVGKTNMRPFPTHLEPQKDKAQSGVQWKTIHGDIDD